MRGCVVIGILAVALAALACKTGRSTADMAGEVARLEKEQVDLETEYDRTVEERERLEKELENTRKLYEEMRSALARRDQLRSELEAMGYSRTEAEVVAGGVARGEGPDTTVAPSKETSTEAEVVAGGVARGEGPDTTVAPSKETSTEAEVVAGGVARGEGPDTTVAPSKETSPAKPASEAAWRGGGGRYAGPHNIHVVVRGECLCKIAGYGKYFGNPERWSAIYEVNAYQIKDPHWIFIGQRLQIPTP